MKRPIFTITLGFIIGLNGGLYFNIVPFVFGVIICSLIVLKNLNFKTNSNFIRIVKIFIKNKTVLIMVISAFISSVYIIGYNTKYERVYRQFSSGEVIATVVSNKEDSKYKSSYKIKLETFNNQKCTDMYFILRVPKVKQINIKYGDKIKFKGEYSAPEIARNYRGFNYRQYLKTQKIYGIFEANKVDVVKENNLSTIEIFSNYIKKRIITTSNQILPKETKELFLGIMIGYDNELQEDIKESFNKSNLTHLLAVSGAHVAYIIVGLTYILSKLKLRKKIRNLLIALFLIFFMYITEFSSSIVRATIMGILALIPTLIYRKQDIKNTISFSLIIILIDNPYKILDVGLILSYFSTIGIILCSKIKMEKKENTEIKYKVYSYIKDLLVITLFANIFVLPIMIYNFNTISLTFLISNLIAGIIIGPITIGGFILICASFINIKLSYILAIPYNLLLKGLIISTNIVSEIPFSQIFISTPNVSFIIIYYLILFLIFSYIVFEKYYSNRYIFKKIQKCINYIKQFLKENIKLIIILILFIFIISFILNLFPKDIRIHFVDVGQGDSTLVISPTNKKILIDSGGSESGNFDVGESTLFPYLLDRGITCLDYICISHFDSDHCQGFIYLLNNMKIKNIILSKQYESTNNFEEIISIAKKKKINMIKLEAGDVFHIDKYTKARILHPGSKLDEDINNNSIVMKLECFNTSILFTGDISQNTEKQLVEKYYSILKSDILKVAHHGSKTSNSEEFIQIVAPKISLIGVGKNNKFGHPNNEVIEILNNINSKIYRTDLNGEISFCINAKRNNKEEYKYQLTCIIFQSLVNNTKKEFYAKEGYS